MNKKNVNATANVSKRKRNVIGRDQVQMMISYMEEHTLFTRGQITKLGPQGHVKFKNMWIELTKKLNNMGPCVVTAEKWQEKRKNMRLNSKQRTAAYMNQFNKTGHCTPDLELKEDKKRISDIFGKYGVGLHVTPECGFEHSHSFMNNKGNVHFSTLEEVNVTKKLEYNFGNNSKYNTSNGIIRKIVKVTDDQKEVLLQFMQTHPRFAVELTDVSLWEELLLLLSAFEPIKPYQSWKRTWLDSVRAAKQAQALFNAGLRTEPLSDYHKNILQLLERIEANDFTENINIEEDDDMQCKTFKRPTAVQNVQMQKKLKSTNSPNGVSQLNAQENTYNVEDSVNVQPNALSQRTPLMPITIPQQQYRRITQSHTATATATSTPQSINIPILPSPTVQPNVQAFSASSPMRVMQRSPTSLRGSSVVQLRSPVPIIRQAPVNPSSSAAVAEEAKAKSSAFMNAFKESQQDTINKIEACFEKQLQTQQLQQELLQQMLIRSDPQNEILLSLPTVMANTMEISMRKVLQEFHQPTLSNETQNDNDFEDNLILQTPKSALTTSNVSTDENLLPGPAYMINGQQYVVVTEEGMYNTEDPYLSGINNILSEEEINETNNDEVNID